MFFKNKKKRENRADREKLLANFPSNSRYAESFRTLRTNLFFSDLDREIKSVLITSSLEKEGKTNTALNLGYTIAQTDRQVLVMDCDLRRPYLTSLVAENAGKWGVTELVTEVFGVHLTQGGLDTYSIADLVHLPRLQKRSVRLDLENGTTRAAVFFEKGKIVDVRWNNRPESESLLNHLVRENRITGDQAARARDHHKNSTQRVGQILYTLGLVDRETLTRALSAHMVEAIRAICAMEEGRFTVSPLDRDPSPPPAVQTDIYMEALFAEFNTGEDQLKFCNAAIEKAILPTELDNLFVMPAGQVPPNPAEVVGSGRMAFLMENLRPRFDFIIVDTPPVMPATDALLLAPLVDGTVLVIKSGHTDRKLLQDVASQFRAARQPIIGTVLNQVDLRKESYYYYYGGRT